MLFICGRNYPRRLYTCPAKTAFLAEAGAYFEDMLSRILDKHLHCPNKYGYHSAGTVEYDGWLVLVLLLFHPLLEGMPLDDGSARGHHLGPLLVARVRHLNFLCLTQEMLISTGDKLFFGLSLM